MKKYIIIVSVVIAVLLFADHAYYRLGWYIDFNPGKKVESFVTVEGESIILNKDGNKQDFFIKGVDLGSSIPGKWSTEYAIDEETYLEWFSAIQDMGANTIRVYTVQSDKFYNAFYKHNEENPDPLWLLQGVGLSDYVNNSRVSAVDDSFGGQLVENSVIAVDVIHGRRKISSSKDGVYATGNFTKDVSPWVIGYIIGIDWDVTTVAYTNKMYAHLDEYTGFNGEYMYTVEGAKPFEVLLARVGNELLSYESKKYKTQRLVSFSNYAITDPFEYNEEIKKYFTKVDSIDVENIKTTDKVLSGQFASYSVFPYFPDFLRYFDDWENVLGFSKDEFLAKNGSMNTYKAYLTAIMNHHTMPVVISEFGTSTARTIAYQDVNTQRNSGMVTEEQQGYVIKQCYEDIVSAGANGACIYKWQDEWCRRTWNTMHAVDLGRTPYWSDFQTGEQFFGLLTFDPGKEKSICYVDGNVGEWKEEDKIVEGGCELSVKYDEKFVYFMVHKENYDFENDVLYIPIDTTQKTGSNYSLKHNLKFDRSADFIITINGRDNSCIEVHERYDALRSTYSNILYKYNTYQKERTPDANAPDFVPINLILEKVKFEDVFIGENFVIEMQAQGKLDVVNEIRKPVIFETGKLVYGNANPDSDNFNSLADFCVKGDFVEIRIPWQLLNFSDPSEMQIHDDYYDGNYGIEYIYIDEMYAGVSNGEKRIPLAKIKLEGWGKNVTYHERIKDSYYIVQEMWRTDGNNEN